MEAGAAGPGGVAETPGTGGGTTPDKPKGGGGAAKIALIALIALLVGGGVGYFVGDKAADADGAEKTGHKEGLAEGKKQGYAEGYTAGKTEGNKTGERAGKTEGKQIGFTEGDTAGLEKGKSEGEAKGDAEGIASGANAALGGYSSYTPGFYVVNVQPGSGGVESKVTSRLAMEPNTIYNICTKNSADICQKPIPGQ